MKPKNKRLGTAKRVPPLARGSASGYETYEPGTTLSLSGGNYRVEVAAQLGPIIFAHAVFTTGDVQRAGSVQALDVRDYKDLTRVKAGEKWTTPQIERAFARSYALG